jgi:hypothetical protein
MGTQRILVVRRNSERGVALIAALLVMMLMSALMIGFTTVVMSDQRFRFIDKDRTRAFYAAQSGIEKLTADLGNLFLANVAPTATEIADLADTPPVIPDVTFTAPTGVTAYGATLKGSGNGQILSGPYQGLTALKTFYDLDAVAHTSSGAEVHLTRRIETVAIPVFQFGMYSEVDLSLSAAANFDFGGRVHTNGNLFLAQGGISATLTLRDRVTAVKEIVRQRLSNTNSIDASVSNRTVRVATSTNTFRDLARTEGSVTDGLSPATLNPDWTTLSLSTYNGYLRNGRTGAKPLNLALIAMGPGATSLDLIRRPPINEHVVNADLFGERYYKKVSLRILLSDTVADLTSLPTVDNTAPPVLLDGNWNITVPNNGTAYGPIDASHPPIARSPGLNTVNLSAAAAAGNNVTLTVASVPAYFRPPTLRLLGIDVTCSGRTTNQFIGCAVGAPAAATGTPVTARDPVNSVPNVSTNLTAPTVVNALTLDVTSNGTQQFAPITFWLKNTLVTCTGNTATTFTGCNNVPAAVAGDTITTSALSWLGTGVIGGYIKIEMQDTTPAWRDVTMEILNWGISGPNLGGAGCGDPTPNAIVRLQRLRDNGNAAVCTYAGSINAADHWPNVLFDGREALQRDLNPGTTNLILGGVMHYITLDVANLSKWFEGAMPYDASSGGDAFSTNNGYAVYVSDRRNNRDAANLETGEYGWEDFVNPLSGTGVPDGLLNVGEDVNASTALDMYGQFPSYDGVSNTLPPGFAGMPAPFNSATTVRPTTQIGAGAAKVNRAYLFRRALKLVNGSLGNIVAPGLTIAAENPIYLQGDWNANAAGFGDPHVATSVVGDAVTMLSNNWNDIRSFGSPGSPYATSARPRSAHTYYRVAVIAGKGPIFPWPAGTLPSFGTDGGAQSFLRMLEGTGGAPNTIHYRGSMVTFYYNRQTIGAYKCCGNVVYATPARDYQFDLDFLDPAKLPPLTPLFRDLNALGFSQEFRPGR